MDKTYDPKQVEQKIYQFWQKTGFFNPDNLPLPKKNKNEKFVVAMAPLNVTGEAHMGHALENSLIDVLVRKKRMSGQKVLWVPGTDHAGIATQNVVEKKLKKEAVSRFNLGREKFIEEIWNWKNKYGNIILDQLKKMGLSCDWSRTAFTMDENYAKAVEHAFLHYYKKRLIYQGERPINWCRRCQTSLSDLELEYQGQKGKLYYIKYPLKSQIQNFIIVATTRPETMPGDTAVAVNPEDARYKNLVGETAILPVANKEIPIIADKIVDPNFGTGAVKITPAHDLKDYEVGIRHKLATISVINEKGRMNENAPSSFSGLNVLEARQKILNELQILGLLEKQEDYENSIPSCYRCGTAVEIIPSKQWFLKMDGLAKKAIQVVRSGKIKFYPKNFEKIYFNWLKNIRDWCISRQIWWGHQLPVWRCQTGKNQKSSENYFVSEKTPKKCPLCDNCQPKQIEDVLDTWFSSALWPFAIFGWPKKTKDFRNFYPTNLISSDRGIINLWHARMIFSALEFTKKPPFQKIFIHATVLTKTGQRMSKSLGTGVNPTELIEKYGSDATRFGLIWQATGVQDIRFDEQNIVAGKKFCNKIWNAARFVIQQTAKSKIKEQKSKIQIKSQKLTTADKKILRQLQKTVKSVDADLENFRFSQAIQTVYHFFWHEFCDDYLEESKKRLNKEILIFVLTESLKLLHPFMPFITEEIYQMLPLKNKKKSIMIEEWPVSQNL